jgi:SAM-dependent methyltransferase
VTRTEEVYSRYSRSPRKRRAWASDNPGNLAIRRELLAELLRLAAPELRGPGMILDLGCGTGWWLRSLAESGVDPARLWGIEEQPARVGAARQAVPGARIEAGDARALELEDAGFSLVLLFTVVSSLPTSEAVTEALGEARRMLEPGGLLLVYEPRVTNPFNRNTRRLGDSDLDAAGLSPREQISMTLLPPLARRLGARTEARYERLARLSPLRTHRLISFRAPA